MGMLERFRGERPDDNPLGLPSTVRVPDDVRRASDRERAVQRERARLVAEELMLLNTVGDIGVMVARNITVAAEQAAAAIPYERARVDTVADSVAAAVARKVQALGQLG